MIVMRHSGCEGFAKVPGARARQAKRYTNIGWRKVEWQPKAGIVRTPAGAIHGAGLE